MNGFGVFVNKARSGLSVFFLMAAFSSSVFADPAAPVTDGMQGMPAKSGQMGQPGLQISPEMQQRMQERWQSMSPDQQAQMRQRAGQMMQRWEAMSPEQRQGMMQRMKNMAGGAGGGLPGGQ